MKKYFYPPRHQAGFTLIEFLIASALSMIVIIAAGSTYLITRKLNANAQQRLDVQQNLRNAASMITRDARNTGSFGCFSTVKTPTSVTVASSQKTAFPTVSNGATRQLELDNSKNNGFGVRLVSYNQAVAANMPGINNIRFQGNAIVFIYGKGGTGVDSSVLSNAGSSYTLGSLKVNNYANDPDFSQAVAGKGDLVVSSCTDAYVAKPTAGTSTSITFNSVPADRLLEAQNSTAEISVNKLYGVAYAVATVNGINSLVRYDIGANGNWQGPQLLAQNVQSLTPLFGYVEDCANDSADATKHNAENFVFSDTLSKTQLPAVVRMQLTYTYPGSTDTADYIINATIRGGNICSSTMPVK